MKDHLFDPNKFGYNEPISEIYLIWSLEQERKELWCFLFEAQEKRRVCFCKDKLDSWGSIILKVFERSEDLNLFKTITIHVNRNTGEKNVILESSLIVIIEIDTNQIQISRNHQIKCLQDEDMKILSDDLICGGKVLNLVASKNTGSDMDIMDIKDGDDLDGDGWDDDDLDGDGWDDEDMRAHIDK